MDPSLGLHGMLEIVIKSARDLPKADLGGSIDPYVQVFAPPHRIAKTKYKKDNRNPEWNETFIADVLVDKSVATLEFRVYDKDYNLTCDDYVCAVFVPVEQLANSEILEGEFPLVKPENPDEKSGGTLSFSVQYRNVAQLGDSREVSHTYFKQATGNLVHMYNDAHVSADTLSPVPLAHDRTYTAQCCWRDMYNAINAAKLFVYVAGWSVNTQISLLRLDDDRPTIGELLKRKAEEGVKVCVMVWNEALSLSFGASSTTGMMATHDEETKKYFQGTKVEVFLCPRQGQDQFSQDKKGVSSYFVKACKFVSKTVCSTAFVGMVYTHHQKTVITDSPALDGSEKRRIISFVGGLDLCDGRWDTPEHPLFGTLDSLHAGDFHQGITGVPADRGPRQPWHDIHSLVEGPSARHVMYNFLERWEEQNPNGIGALYDQEKAMRNGVVVSADEESIEDSEQWAVQVFRSIDGRSCNFNRCAREALALQMKKGRPVDCSIHRAYLHHIRRAKSFLYIENQYFLGSSQAWTPPEKGACHFIPLEIVTKIREKIFSNQPFCTYIIVPLFPEGDPESAAVMEILHWQQHTVEMMYRKIAEAIKEKGIDAHPTDYLGFYCLGKREKREEEETNNVQGLTEVAKRLIKSGRNMIYVHSKMMIVDDEFVLIGSANINQRSMDGARDTEIAIGGYQLAHTVDEEGVLPKGQVHGFRTQLWQEHLGSVDSLFNDPSSLACSRHIHKVADNNWAAYAADDFEPMTGHLMTYPYVVDQEGHVTALENYASFPDFPNSSVLGQKSTNYDALNDRARLLTM